MPKTKLKPAQKAQTYWVIDWRIEGSYRVLAGSAEEAQEKFDKDWCVPRGIMPMRDGEFSSDTPVKE